MDLVVAMNKMKNRGLVFLLLSAVATILGPAQVSAQNIGVTPMDFDFGAVDIGTTATLNVLIDSLGPSPLTIFDIEIRDDPTGVFDVSGPALPLILDVTDSITYQIAFAPLDVGLHSANLRIGSNAVPPGDYLLLPLRGVGRDVTAIPEPHSLLLIGLGVLGIGFGWRKRTAVL